MKIWYRTNSICPTYSLNMVKTSDVPGYDYAVELNGFEKELYFEYVTSYVGETKVPFATTYGLPQYGYKFNGYGVYGIKDGKVVCLDDLDDPENSMY